MSCQELQEEELEVLRAIYEGDSSFKEISPVTFQYKYGEDNDHKSLIMELQWGDSYPDSPPTINMDTFYNKHILESVKKKIIDGTLEQVEDLLGTAMSYTLFEWVKENYEDLTTDLPNERSVLIQVEEKVAKPEDEEISKKKDKKEHLTKHQKRRMFDKMGNAAIGDQRPRGFDWVDVVKHLSQTGSQQE